MKLNIHPGTMKKNHQAFTLVELLVVIVIIAIMAGIALPVFQKAQEKARAVSDLSNLRQFGIAIQAYRGDNDNNIFDSADATNPKWQNQLYPTYISTWKVFKSPFDKRAASETTASAPISYGLNNTSGTGGGAGTLFGIDASKLNYPSNLILMAPALDFTAGSVVFPATNVGTADVFIAAPAAAVDKGTHSSRMRINALFADGHTEDILFAKFKDATTPDGLKRWVYNTL